MKTLYAITHINRDGMRTLTHSNRGENHHATKEAAESRLVALRVNNSTALVTQVFGSQALGTFQVWPVECYDHGDAVGIYFDDPNAPFDKAHKQVLA